MLLRKIFHSLALLTLVALNSPAQINDAEANRIAAYPITADLFQRYASVTIAMAKLPVNDPIRAQLNALPSAALDERVRRFEASPGAVSILKSNGISARDMVMTSAAVSSAMVVKPAMKAGVGPNAATKLDWASTSPDHLKFFDTHKADIDKFQVDLRAAMGLPPRH